MFLSKLVISTNQHLNPDPNLPFASTFIDSKGIFSIFDHVELIILHLILILYHIKLGLLRFSISTDSTWPQTIYLISTMLFFFIDRWNDFCFIKTLLITILGTINTMYISYFELVHCSVLFAEQWHIFFQSSLINWLDKGDYS